MNIKNLYDVIDELEMIDASNILGGVLNCDLEQAKKDVYILFDLSNKIKEILKGIDKDYHEDDNGWWPTTAGSEFGAKKLKEILELVYDHNQLG